MIEQLAERVAIRLAAAGGDEIAGVDWVAYSGGLDSSVLLHLMATRTGPACRTVRAVHINHQLRPEADRWARHCELTARELGVACDVRSVTVPNHPPEGPEAAARAVRYRALRGLIGRGDRLLLAHHAGDQLETVLLRLLRGSGVAGLAGMPARRPFGAGVLVRPLLRENREVLHQYAFERGVEWIEDDSNGDLNVPRNYLRSVVIPELLTRWPAARRTAARTAAHCAEGDQLLQDLAALDGDPGEENLDIGAWSGLSAPRRKNLLRVWLSGRCELLPGSRRIEAFCEQLTRAREDRLPVLTWSDGEVRCYRRRLHYLSRSRLCRPSPPGRAIPVGGAETVVPGIGRLLARQSEGEGLARRLYDDAAVSLRFRRGGESLRLPRRPTKSLKHLMQEWGIPPWERPVWPLVFVGENLAAVPGFGYAEEYMAQPGEQAVDLSWRPISEGDEQ